MSSTKTLLGFVAGAAVGALAGILLAPDKGSETRKKVLQKTKDLGNSLKDAANGYVDSVKDSISNVKSEVKNVKDQITPKSDFMQNEEKNQWS